MFTRPSQLKELILHNMRSGCRFIVAIDGRCASGKTTLAGRLQRETGCTVIHMDDFFLRPEQRSPERLEQPGGNVDHERFATEVLGPVLSGVKKISWRRFNCKSGNLERMPEITLSPVIIVEGSYSCHSELWDSCDYHVFMTVSEDLQKERILKREGENAGMFFNRWIPLEEKYFSHCRIEERCEICIDGCGKETI